MGLVFVQGLRSLQAPSKQVKGLRISTKAFSGIGRDFVRSEGPVALLHGHGHSYKSTAYRSTGFLERFLEQVNTAVF